MSFGPRLSAATFLLLALSAGIANADSCQTIYDCGYRENCKAGVCVFDGLSCKYDTECGAFEFCNTGAYQCQVSQGRCHTSSDCYGYQSCDANNYCSPSQQYGTQGNDSPPSPPLINASILNTSNKSLSDFGSTDPKLNASIQKMKKSVNASIARAEQQSSGSVGGFFAAFFAFLRKLIFGG